ncbi:hypothetical protein ABN262_03245 [Citrobacter youngae]|uniref:hypothetical protein n=1 Tax=Citrobacter TaxID=544 RepID=UPI0022E8F0AA|nr:hypothetical protein [Citrobacter youngae]MDL4457647.1 hypothetical protein [Citrobacter youngae]
MSNIDKQARHVQRYTNYGVDMMEWDDGKYVKYSDYLALLDELEAAEKRIAELEARTVKLPEALIPAIHNSGEPFMRPEPFGLYLNRDDVLRALRAAGIGVKGE